MNLKYLESFLALAKYNNFSSAADSLFISQSSLSKNIRKLEEETNAKLFLRTPIGTSLTEYGKTYYGYAKKIALLQEQCTDEINKMRSKEVTLRIGSIPSSAEYGVLDLIINFMKVQNIRCKITTNQSSILEHELINKQLDLAFIKNTENKNLNSFIYKYDHMVVVLPKTHPLARKKVIDLKNLCNEDFIFEPVNSRPYNLCISLCKSAGFIPNVIYTDRLIDNVIEFVKKGLGVSLLMSKIVPESEDVVKIPIEPNTVAKVSLCYLKNEDTSQPQQKFIDYTQKKIEKESSK